MATPPLQLVRKGNDIRDPQREKRVEIDPPRPKMFLPPILTQQKFVVPRKDFASPVDMDGKPLRARIQETDEVVEVYPEFRLIGVEEVDGGKRLAQALYHGLDQQIHTLRLLLDGIFRSQLGDYSKAESVEKITTRERPEYRDLRERIAAELGLRLEWTLQPEPKTAEWLAGLVRASPTSDILSYNKDLPSTEFNLAFSFAVERASLSNLHRLQRRARQGLSAEQEFAYIFRRVREITNPAFRAVWTGVNVWNRDLVRELAVDGFAKVVAERLTRECGYVVKFSDFVPELSSRVVETIERSSSRQMLLDDCERNEILLRHLKDERHETLKKHDGNFAMVRELDENIAQARQELSESKAALLAGDQKDIELVREVQPGMLKDMSERFRTALMLEEKAGAASRYEQPN